MNTCIPKLEVARLKERVKKGEVTPEEVAKMLPEQKQALKGILEEFVADKYGVSASSDEIATIKIKANKIQEAQKKLGDNLGNPDSPQENIAFFKAKKEMEDYLMSKDPASRLQVTTGTIGRGMMLASVKSPILNIGANTEVGITEALVRRVSQGSWAGANDAVAIDFVKMANKIYQETGYDISRMMSLADTGTAGERVLGQTIHAQGPGAIRAVGRVVEDIVFKQLMGAPDVAFASTHFADSVGLSARKLAKGDKAKGTEIMKDAMRIEPRTPEGIAVREQGILDAQVATWTNDSWASKVSEGIRRVVNDVSGDARVGDFIFPFVKTPANVISTGIDYAGGGIPKALIKTVKAIKSGQLGSKEYIKSVTRDLVRSGLGFTGAAVIASQLKDEDFVGAYDPKRAQIEQLRNSNYNAIRIGNKWVSVDWLGPLSVPVSGILYARKYGNTPGEMAFQYGKSVVESAKNIPGIKDAFEYAESNAYKQNQTLEEMTGETANYISEQLSARLTPSIISDIAKATDDKDRNTKGNTMGVPNTVVNKIPFLRQTLPEKKNIFGETAMGEDAISDILLGARVKTDKETPLVKEISRVSQAVDKGIAFTDWSKSSSKTLAQFKQKVGTLKYEQARQNYGEELKKELEKTINDPKYKKLTDDEKLKIINDKDTEVMESILKKYGFKYIKEKSPNLPKI